jgi:hypothetical protein
MDNKNIENVEQIKCALANRFKGQQIDIRAVYRDKSEMAALSSSGKTAGTCFYGIVTVGDGTSVALRMLGGGSIAVAQNNQVIELFTHLVIDAAGVGDVFFRGYEINVYGVEF